MEVVLMAETQSVNEASKLKIHKESIEKDTPLSVIREKELEINAKVLETRKKADELVAKAREKAAAIKEKAAEEGPKEAQLFYEKELLKIKEEAEKIRASAASEVKAVKEAGMVRFNEAVEQIVKMTIP